MLMAAMCMAQHGQSDEGDAHTGIMPSSRTDFGKDCGIADTSAESAIGVVRSGDGEWTALSPGGRPGSTDTAVARVWRESNWMVDMHGALGQGMATIHTGQMCFDPQGHITYMIDRFMEMSSCGCVRFTSITFGNDGRITRREQKFVKMATGAEMAAPEAAKEFPEVWDFRKVEQLPFYSLVKK
jgi:hypothetical protein